MGPLNWLAIFGFPGLILLVMYTRWNRTRMGGHRLLKLKRREWSHRTLVVLYVVMAGDLAFRVYESLDTGWRFEAGDILAATMLLAYPILFRPSEFRDNGVLHGAELTTWDQIGSYKWPEWNDSLLLLKIHGIGFLNLRVPPAQRDDVVRILDARIKASPGDRPS